MAEELWERLGHAAASSRPAGRTTTRTVAKAEQIVVPVQVNGKLRARLTVPADIIGERPAGAGARGSARAPASRGQDGQEGDGGARDARQHRGGMKYWHQAVACVLGALVVLSACLQSAAATRWPAAARSCPLYIKTIGVPQFINLTSIPMSIVA